MTVERAHEDGVAENRDAAIHATATGARQRRRAIRIGPEHAPGRGIERHEIVRRLDGVHDAVHHQRRRLELLERLRLEHPSELEILHVGGRDLGQRAVPLAHHVARMRQPVLRLRRTPKDAVERDLRAASDRQPRNHKGHEGHKAEQHEARDARKSCSSSAALCSLCSSWSLLCLVVHSWTASQRREVADEVGQFLRAQLVTIGRHRRGLEQAELAQIRLLEQQQPLLRIEQLQRRRCLD